MRPNDWSVNARIVSTPVKQHLVGRSWFPSVRKNAPVRIAKQPRSHSGVFFFLGVGGSRRTNTKTAELSPAVVRSSIDDGVPEMATVSASVVLAVAHVPLEDKISAGVRPSDRCDTTPESYPSVAF